MFQLMLPKRILRLLFLNQPKSIIQIQIQKPQLILKNSEKSNKLIKHCLIQKKENITIKKMELQDNNFKEIQHLENKKMYIKSEHIRQNEAEYSDYFEKQYFRNPDYFKRKVDEDSPWNISYDLYKKHYDIKKEKSEYVLHVPTETTSYWERKEDMKERTLEQKAEDFKNGKSLYIGLFITMIIGGIYYIYQDQNQNKQRVSSAGKVKEGSGYKVKALPLNIV
ncbi:unnamed protein product [Paramecium sonneborni]|uniref:Transmembrane protein n=1 Tax=Paramecium sonneborni TaxID=65129 RepID=A0A8S1MFJ1_9CILI|nr:unnamed protein product [Paramecium sonneborni]